MHRIELVVEDIFEIPNVDELLGMSRDEKWERAAHLVDRLADPRLTNHIQSHVWLLHYPKLDHAIPASRHQNLLAIF